jgi:hypothetical protein
MNDQQPQKPLSEHAAISCEEARGSTCLCRCGGLLHGAKRGGASYGKQADGSFVGTPRAFFEHLAEDDPHFILSAEAKAQLRQERKEQKRREREEVAEDQRNGARCASWFLLVGEP